MRTRIVRMGSEQGIRIPRPLLEQTGLRGEVEISAQDDSLIIRPVSKPCGRLGRCLCRDGGKRRRYLDRWRAASDSMGRGGMGMAINRFGISPLGRPPYRRLAPPQLLPAGQPAPTQDIGACPSSAPSGGPAWPAGRPAGRHRGPAAR